MATQYRDGSWSETKELVPALEVLSQGIAEGTAKRFVVGTRGEVEQEKQRIVLEEQIAELRRRLDVLEASEDPGLIDIPTKREVMEILGTKYSN